MKLLPVRQMPSIDSFLKLFIQPMKVFRFVIDNIQCPPVHDFTKRMLKKCNVQETHSGNSNGICNWGSHSAHLIVFMHFAPVQLQLGTMRCKLKYFISFGERMWKWEWENLFVLIHVMRPETLTQGNLEREFLGDGSLLIYLDSDPM